MPHFIPKLFWETLRGISFHTGLIELHCQPLGSGGYESSHRKEVLVEERVTTFGESWPL